MNMRIAKKQKTTSSSVGSEAPPAKNWSTKGEEHATLANLVATKTLNEGDLNNIDAIKKKYPILGQFNEDVIKKYLKQLLAARGAFGKNNNSIIIIIIY
jgi:hypothetical protein